MTRCISLTLLMLVSAGVCASQSQPVSLGDVARHNRANKKAGLVVTEDNIASVSGTISIVGSESVQPDNPQTAVATAPAVDNREAPPSSDTAQIADLRKQLALHQKELEGWKSSAKSYEDRLKSETNEFRRETYETALANDRVNAERSQKQVDEAQAALDKAQQAAADKQQKGTEAAVDKTQ